MLSHHNLPALKRMVKSVEQQYEEKNLIIEPVIVINTLNDQYYEDVLNEGFSYKVVRTESNGKPGKGKNSCRQLFLDSDADYLTQVDGDDFLYPTFVKSIWEHIEWYPCMDVLGKHPMDAVANEQVGGHHFKVGKNEEYWGCVGVIHYLKDQIMDQEKLIGLMNHIHVALIEFYYKVEEVLKS